MIFNSFAVAVMLAACAATPLCAAAAPSGLAFDEISFQAGTGQPRPQAPDFERDYRRALTSAERAAAAAPVSAQDAKAAGRRTGALAAAAIAGQTALGMLQATLPGLGSLAAGAGGAAFHDAMLARIRASGADANELLATGTLRRYAFSSSGEERIDAPEFHTAIIVKPAQHRAYILDTAQRTWRTKTITDAELAAGSAVLGTASATYSEIGSSRLDAQSIDGRAANGKLVAATVTNSGAHGDCTNATWHVLDAVYTDAAIAEPPLLAEQDADREIAAFPGCAAHITGLVPQDMQLVLFRITDVNGGTETLASDPVSKMLEQDREAANAAGQTAESAPTPETRVVERGHVRALTPEDETLFEIPAGYTETGV